MARSSDITNFTDHRSHLREHFSLVRETGRPLYVTTNGKTDAVVLSPETYDALAEKAELLDSLRELERSYQDLQEGRTRPAKEVLREIAVRLGLKLDR